MIPYNKPRQIYVFNPLNTKGMAGDYAPLIDFIFNLNLLA